MMQWLRRLSRDGREVADTKQESRDARADKSNAAQRLLEALERLDADRDDCISESLSRHRTRRNGHGD